MSYHGLIFDFNGVLLWDTELHEHTWRDFSAALRGKPLSDEELIHQVLGRTNRYILEYLTGRTLTATELHALTEQKEELYRRRCLTLGAAFQLSPGAVELLEFLAAHGIPRTIATASGRSNLDFFIAQLQLTRWFEPSHIVYDDDSFPNKPAPDIYLRAAARLALPPQQCVVVEDSRAGLQAAAAAQIGYLAALGPAATHNSLRQLPGVKAVITSLQELPREELFLV